MNRASPTRLSLQRLLTIPFIVLVLLLALLVGALSYRAGSNAVDLVSTRLLQETVQRIGQAIERHVVGSGAVLEAAFPQGVSAPPDLRTELDDLRARFWIATSLHRDPNNYVYYGNQQGQFMGLWRHSESEAELRVKFVAAEPRAVHRFNGIAGALQAPQREERVFDPRARPWYQAGLRNDAQTWTSIYVDFRTQELVATRARRVQDSSGAPQGVVATDVSLRALDDFVRRLQVSERGFAFIVERDGQLIAASNAPNLARQSDGQSRRVKAGETGNALLDLTFVHLRDRLWVSASAAPGSTRLAGPDGQTLEVGYARVVDTAGLDWAVVVAVPRDDFMSGVRDNVLRTLAAGITAALAVLALGLFIVRRIGRDLARLGDAAKRIGEGDLDTPLAPQHTQELEGLADSFRRMQTKLRTDRLTGLANREAVLQRLRDRMDHGRRPQDSLPLAVMFVDLDRFKTVNDRFGHAAGDRVLSALGLRLRQAVRDHDMVARWAGDEFIVLLDGVASPEAAEGVRSLLQRRLAEPVAFDADQPPVNLGGTVGLAMVPPGAHDADEVIRLADADMYERKRALPEGGIAP